MKRRLPSKRASILLLAALAVLITGWMSWKPLLLRHRIARARSALEARDAGSALQWLQANERLEPNHAETHFWLARANRRLGQFGKVRDHLERAWKLGYAVEMLKREQWLALAQSGRLDKAEPHLAGLLQDPRDDGREICEAYVAGYLLNYRFAPAFRLLDAWQKDFPEDAYPDLIRGRIYEGQLHAKKAIAAYRQALQLDENLKEAWLRLAKLLTSQQQHEEAVAHFDVPRLLDGFRRDDSTAYRFESPSF
jgi:tetratricopeptide (TPR) repeat protein